MLYAAHHGYDFQIWRLATQSILVQGNRGNTRTFSFSPDNATLVVVDNKGNLHLWSIPTRTQQDIPLPTSCSGDQTGVQFTPIGDLLGARCPPDTNPVHFLKIAVASDQHSTSDNLFQFTPNGHLFRIGEALWDATGTKVVDIPPGPTAFAADVIRWRPLVPMGQ